MAAESGEVNAEISLGRIYRYGFGAPADYAQALRWFNAPSARDSAAAQFEVAGMYEEGAGVRQDDARALEIYRRWAAQNYSFALYSLGKLYEEGKGVAADRATAIDYYRRAANGDPPADEAKAALRRLGVTPN